MGFNGMWLDGEPEVLPEGTYRIAINAVKEPNEYALSTEPSNRRIAFLEGTLVGSISIDGEKAVLFTTPGYIYLYDQVTETLTELINIPELNFSTTNPIQGKYKLVNGCERVVYWNDGYNEDRYFNLDTGTFNSVDDFRLIPNSTYPVIDTTVSNTGQLKKGSYLFVIEVLDSSLNSLIKTLPSQPVQILEDNQSIELTISNITGEFVRLSVLQYTSGNGIVIDAYQYEDVIRVTGNILNFTYTGANVVGVDFKSLISTGVYYDTSRYMEVTHGRLLRGNLSEKAYDYSSFQKSASKIKTNYYIEETSDNIFTEQGDEVKAYGIVYLMKNGSLSPVFHIPGRRANATDKGPVPDIDGVGNTLRYKLYDTSDSSTKTLGYWESDELYTNPANFCGDDYWGVDHEGYSLSGTNVRYHKIPSREKEPLFRSLNPGLDFEDFTEDNFLKRYIGISFSNVEYPSTDIVGHFFVTASANTVLSSGYLLPFNDENRSKEDSGYNDKVEGRFIHYLPNELGSGKKRKTEYFYNTVKQNFISPYSLVDKKAIKPAYFKVNNLIRSNYNRVDDSRQNAFSKGSLDKKYEAEFYGKYHTINGSFDPLTDIVVVEKSDFIPYKSDSKGYSNRSLNHGMNLITAKEKPKYVAESTNLRYVYAKTNTEVFQSLFSIRYRFMNSSPLTETASILFSGDVLISPVNITNISKIFESSAGTPGTINTEYEVIRFLFMETKYDFTTIDNDYYFGIENNENLSFFGVLINPSDALYTYSFFALVFAIKLISDKTTVDGESNYTLRESIHEIRYDPNKDIGVIADQRITYPLSISFNYCSECRNHYPNRIIFSEVNSQEQQSDSWRVYAPLNYQDLPGHRGSITAFDYTGGMLIVRMRRGLFMLQPDPQRIEMSGASLYLGNPQFLGVPAQEIATDASGYAGQQSRLASVVTPSGLFWYDEDAGKVFGYAGQVTELSRNGMYNFFGQDFTTSQLTQLSYDPYYERVIIHRRSVIGKVVNTFTVSYSMVTKSWVSFHSYSPDFMFYLNKTFYTSFNSALYSHDEKHHFCRFFDKDFYFQVGLVYGSMQTMQWHSVHYYAPVFKWQNNRWNDVLNKTFDKAFAHTRKQCTGLVDLLLTNDASEIITWNEKTKTVVQADRNYRIGGLRDMSVADGILSSEWEDRESFYDGIQGYQDVVPANIDFNKPQHEQLMFRDKFIQLRLLFKANEYKMLIYVADYTKLPQTR